MNWATLLAGLAGPLALRALTFLGFGLVSYAAVTTGTNLLIQQVQSSYAGLPLVVLQLAGLAKIPEGLGLILGAYVARVALWVQINGVRWIMGAK